MTNSVDKQDLYRYALRMGDSTLILSQRFCEKVGTSPFLEEEIAQANIGLDILGQAMVWLGLAAEWQGEGKTADDLAYWRTEREYTNYLICELENGDFARVVLRGYLFACFAILLYREMQKSNQPEIMALAVKSSKELQYHVEHLTDWVERLALGTDESHKRMQDALDFLWPYTQEMFAKDELETKLTELEVIPDKETMHSEWLNIVKSFFQECELEVTESKYHYDGGTNGLHTEEMGFLLSEMQTVTREHPDGVW